MEMEWQVGSSAARLAVGGSQNQTKTGGGGPRQLSRPVTRTLWAEEDEEGEGGGEGEDGEEEDETQEGGVGVDSEDGDKEKIVAFIRRMAFNVGNVYTCLRQPDHSKRSKRSSSLALAQLFLR